MLKKEENMPVDISISIVNFRSEENVVELITSIKNTVSTKSYEILVSNNDLPLTLNGIKSSFPEVKISNNDGNLFFTKADNLNLSKANGKYLLSINPDVVVLDDSIELMVDFLEKNPSIGAVSPKFQYPDGTLQPSFGGFVTLFYGLFEVLNINAKYPNNKVLKRVMTSIMDYDTNNIQFVEVLYGACILVRKEVVETVGLKNEIFVHGWDEYDWCHRIRMFKWKLAYLPQAVVMHHRSKSVKEFVKDKSNNELIQALHWDGFFNLYRLHYGYFWYFLLRCLRSAYLFGDRQHSRICGLPKKLKSLFGSNR